MVTIGIDYSVTLPAMCILEGEEFNINSMRFHYVSDKETWLGSFASGLFTGHEACIYKGETARISRLSDVFIDQIDFDCDVRVAVEDYAFAGNGKITYLAENMGILKYKLFLNDVIADIAPINKVKLLARDSYPITERRTIDGKLVKMDKTGMYNAFVHDTGINLLEVFGVKELLTQSGGATRSNPITDIVDAYFIAKYLHRLRTGK